MWKPLLEEITKLKFNPVVLVHIWDILAPGRWKPLLEEMKRKKNIKYSLPQLQWELHILNILGPDIWKPILEEIF